MAKHTCRVIHWVVYQVWHAFPKRMIYVTSNSVLWNEPNVMIWGLFLFSGIPYPGCRQLTWSRSPWLRYHPSDFPSVAAQKMAGISLSLWSALNVTKWPTRCGHIKLATMAAWKHFSALLIYQTEVKYFAHGYLVSCLHKASKYYLI